MILNENLFEEYDWNPDDASSDLIDMESDKPENQPINMNLEEDFSKYLPDWLIKSKGMINMLDKRGIDLANVEFIGADIPKNGHDPDIKNPDLLKVYHLEYGNPSHPSHIVYIPGYNDAESIDLLHNGRYAALKYYSVKQLLDHTIDFGYIDLTKASNTKYDKVKERRDYKKGAFNLDRNKNAQFTTTPIIGYEKKSNGYNDYDKPIYADLKWVEKDGYDKSGYPINPDKYKNLLIELQAENSQKALEDCYAKIENTRNSIIELMSKINIKSKDGYDMFRTISNASNNLSNIIYNYNDTLKSIEWYNSYKGEMSEESIKRGISKEIKSLIESVNKDIEYIKRDLDRVELINNRDKNIEESIVTISKSEMDKLDKEVEESTKEVAQYKIKLKKLSDGSVEPDFSETPEDKIDQAKLALDRYNKAIEARPDRAKDEINYVESLTESIKPNLNSEKLQNIAKKHQIEILSPMGGDDNFRVFGTVRDLDNFYKEATKLGLLSFDDNDNNIEIEEDSKFNLDEALHGWNEFDNFFKLLKKLGFQDYIPLNRLKYILDQGRKHGKTEFEAILDTYRRYGDKIPDDYLNGLTQEFMDLCWDVGIVTNEDFRRFVEEEVQPGETPTIALKRYMKELEEVGFPFDKIRAESEELFNKIHANDNKNNNDNDNDNINEGVMSEIAYLIKDAGGEENLKSNLEKEIEELNKWLNFLKDEARNQMKQKIGNFDSEEEIIQAEQEAMEELKEKEKTLSFLK